MKRYYSKEHNRLMLSPKVEMPDKNNFRGIDPGFFEFDHIGYNKVTKAYNTWLFSLQGKRIGQRKDQVIRNLVNPELRLYILEQAQGGIIRQEKTNQLGLFNDSAA
jgi:hypothetical protein